ncbi:Asp-tRNA(Asn)/Glu-tRNA(Gln) amidotransferase A subunit family amidase [Bradyrhizobium sp. AZCC 2262]|uniref:hypothetical protein n=1 Tax=Bradyrhizobium sp. AZCC 2262 TaxID=3117022 RepID=UPI003073672B
MLALVEAAIDMLETLGADVVPTVFPSIEELIKRHRFMSMSELAAAHEETYPAKADRYGPYIRKGLETGLAAKATDLAKAHWERRKFTGSVRRMFDDVQITVLPVFKIDDPDLGRNAGSHRGGCERPLLLHLAFERGGRANGHPALRLLTGRTPRGVPAGRHAQLGSPASARCGRPPAGNRLAHPPTRRLLKQDNRGRHRVSLATTSSLTPSALAM